MIGIYNFFAIAITEVPRSGLLIREVSVHYLARRSGESKLKSFLHGIQLLLGCVKGFRELIFIPKKEFYIKRENKLR